MGRFLCPHLVGLPGDQLEALRTSAGPTFGLEAGTMRREGDFVYGVIGAIEYAPAIGGYGYAELRQRPPARATSSAPFSSRPVCW